MCVIPYPVMALLAATEGGIVKPRQSPWAECWKRVESECAPPTRMRLLRVIEWSHFAENVAKAEDCYVQTVIGWLYGGDILILRNAFPDEFMRELKAKTVSWTRSREQSFHKMVNGAPDFHRMIDIETGKKYSLEGCKHSAYFFRWNDDPLGIWPAITERWSVIKVACGLRADEYETNLPSDGPVDRIQVVRYPPSIGFLEPHQDPATNQRCFISGYMSKRGADYQGGGFYGVDENNRLVDLEGQIEIGDMAIGYATVCHGVAPCDRGRAPDWTAADGRWFLGLYSNSPDTGKRDTTKPEKVIIPGVLP